jgi:hypothetical protein
MVSYQSLEEQVGVERYFYTAGLLIPTFHTTYWLGLYIANSDLRVWPSFMWLDGQPMPSTHQLPKRSYGHWGLLDLANGQRREEPNNMSPPEFCVVANASQEFGGAWGWSDTNCDDRRFSMCKVLGECCLLGCCLTSTLCHGPCSMLRSDTWVLATPGPLL